MKKTFFYKILYRFTIPLLIPIFLLGCFSFIVSESYVKNEINEKNYKMLEQTKYSVEMIFNDIDTIYYTFNLNSQVLSSLKPLLREQLTGYTKLNTINVLMNLINPHANAKPYIQSIYVYMKNNHNNFLVSNEGLISTDNFFDKEWLNTLDNQNTKSYIEKRSIQRFTANIEPTKYITLYQKFNSPGSTHYDGQIVVNLKYNNLVSLLASMHYFPEQEIFLLNSNNDIIANSNENSLFTKDVGLITNLDHTSFFQKKINNKSYIISSIISNKYDIKFVSITPKSYFYMLPIKLVYMTILLLITALILGIIKAYYSAMQNYNNLNVIFKIFNNAESGLPLPELPSKIDDEYSYILQNITKTFVEQSYLNVQLSEKKYKLKLMEMIALQSNISPHFLTNTLQSIFWKSVSMSDGYNELSHMISCLASIVQYTIHDAHKTVTLEEEINYTKSYVDIQKIRYKDKFELIWEYDPDILSCKVIKLILQPLIENSIYHGIKEQDQFGYIKVKLMKRDEILHITVIDTGIGMKKDTLIELRNTLSSNEDMTKHIGVFNTYKRITLMYGDRSYFKMMSKYNFGTVVNIKIPIVMDLEI